MSATGTFNSNKGFNDRNQFYQFQTELQNSKSNTMVMEEQQASLTSITQSKNESIRYTNNSSELQMPVPTPSDLLTVSRKEPNTIQTSDYTPNSSRVFNTTTYKGSLQANTRNTNTTVNSGA